MNKDNDIQIRVIMKIREKPSFGDERSDHLRKQIQEIRFVSGIAVANF